ncbi:AzlD domain-containing protein [Dactylosporangium sp. AC04546]|uniref:branched-chain amino acid transporter permease n=1 Tax=Dactylosporangium sp. AC04546 TaxID=2862460 RepID=UPI001EDDC79A|nr:AzlD domain-containing protein [Dactylosporangium sp. AC04546]WVK86736.1 AzlD domain-containing protein [Dactylosporangium sp. AC04546]
MPDAAYVAVCLVVAVAITVSLRAAPFAMKNALQQSALLADIGRWMPLGAIAILAIYCLTKIDLTAPGHGVAELAGVVVTVVVHWWRRNLLLSIAAGTAVCLILTNWVLPA